MMDTHREDILDIDTARDYVKLVIDYLDKLNLLKNGKSFKFHVQQCKRLCSYILDKLSPYVENNVQYQGRVVWIKSVQRAWKEIYRAAKEAEIYLKHCSTDGWGMECVILSNTGEAFALHMHDLAWSLLCLDLALLCPIQAGNDSTYREKVCNRICDFCTEMSGLHLEQFGFKFQDYWHLLMTCNQTAAKAWTSKQKNKIGVLQFMERKLLETIRNECKIESATGIATWLQIPPKDLILKKKTIGKGSYGAVYKGSWLGHTVAVKDIPIDARDLFDRETAVLAKAQSPFIVQLIGTCIEGSHCYVVMELVSSSLDKLLKNSGGRAPLALPVAVDMMLQISRGMEYLHRQGIMHMDLKASNVLIEPSAVPEFREQGYGRVKLCDFGMASLRLSSFRCEDPKGTCYWRAPEAFPFPNEELLEEIDTLKEYTYKADVYSFAMTSYEILMGKQPFLDVLPKDLYRMIVRGRRPILQPTSCPAVLADYIVKCWETDPRRRPCFAQVSSFLRNMKLFILRMNDPRDWLAKSGGYFYPSEESSELVTDKEEAFDEIPEDEKMKSITRNLHIVPAEIKRKYNINVARAMPSEQSNVMPSEKTNAMPSEKLNAMPSEKSNEQKYHPNLVFYDVDHLLRSSGKVLGKGSFGTTYIAKSHGSSGEVLGKGSFGTTYIAKSHGLDLVVKRSSEDTTYVGKKRDFERRLQALRSLTHTNLVSLQAYRISKEEKVFVYNYLPNGSVYSLLHTKREPLEWDRGMKIALDVASGLEFLHKSGMVHGNVKSSNILLDNYGNACITDSCIAGLVKNSSAAIKFSGYVAPEQYDNGKMSKKSDVYSFGVLLLELLTGMNPSSASIDLPTWVRSIEKEFDVKLKDMQDISEMLGLAMLCSSPDNYTRPITSNRPIMSYVVQAIRCKISRIRGERECGLLRDAAQKFRSI